MRRTFLKTAAAALLATAAFGTGPAAAQSAADYYKGNTINFIVPYNPGGGYDEYARMIAPYLEKYTGARVDIKNVPGSGGMKGAVEIFNAPADGTYIGIINGSAMVTNQLAEIEGANYKVGQYNYLGRIVADQRVLVAASNSGIKSFKDMMAATAPTVVGATGLGGSTYVDAVISGKVFNLDQKVVHGFDRSGDIRTAMLRGDVDVMWGSLGSALDGITAGDHKPILTDQENPEGALAGVPSVYDVAKTLPDADHAMKVLDAWASLSAVGRPVAAPPGVPDDRMAFLRDAFDKAMRDPDFVKTAADNKRELLYASGDQMAKIAKSATELDPDIKALFVAAIRGEI